MKTKYKALVAGGAGVIGRQLVEHLATLPDWEVIGLSRRAPEAGAAGTHIPVDLLDPASHGNLVRGRRDIGSVVGDTRK